MSVIYSLKDFIAQLEKGNVEKEIVNVVRSYCDVLESKKVESINHYKGFYEYALNVKFEGGYLNIKIDSTFIIRLNYVDEGKSCEPD